MPSTNIFIIFDYFNYVNSFILNLKNLLKYNYTITYNTEMFTLKELYINLKNLTIKKVIFIIL